MRSPLRNTSTVRAVSRTLSDACLVAIRQASLLVGEPVRHAVIVTVDIDVIVEASTAETPFGVDVRFGGQRLERRAVEFFEQGTAGDAEAAERAQLVNVNQHLLGESPCLHRLIKRSAIIIVEEI